MAHPGLIKFGMRVRAFRENAGLSQEQLAERAQIHRTYIGGIERGERNVGLKNILRIAGALGVAPAQLFVDFQAPNEHRPVRRGSK
ncbi:MAG: helix-turn-helix transcriptional regulator [Planctomycetes bacterium]|nr:helix-turn-helix transcriptional regulator [Planctomycetota bacterium]